MNDRKLLFLPRWLRWAKRLVDRLLPRQRDFERLMAQQYADRGQAMLALSQSAAADFTRFHGVCPGGSASSTTAWIPSGFRPDGAPRTARRPAGGWASCRRRSWRF